MKDVLDMLRGKSGPAPVGSSPDTDHTILNLDVPNANGRTYTTETAQAMVDQATKRMSDGHALFGELGYPTGEPFSTVDLNRVSHQITEVRVEDGKLIGKMKLLDTPMGNIARTLLDEAPHVGIRPRGLANVQEDGTITDFQLITFDIVSNPA